MNDKEILKLLRSGRFTVITNDRGSYTIYPSRFIDANEQPEEMEVFDINEEDGYLPRMVALMAEALGGSSDSI